MDPQLNSFKTGGQSGQSLESQAGQNHLVFDIVIRYFKKSADLLRSWRFVSRSWNQSASAVLRETTSVTLAEYDWDKVASFKRLQRARKKDKALQLLASPFRKIKLTAQSFTERGFINFIRRWDSNLVVTHIFLREQSEKVNEPKKKWEVLQKLLILCGETSLKYLEFQWRYFKSPKPEEFNWEKAKLDNLKTLNFRLYYENSSNFFKTILRHSTLHSLEIQFMNSLPLDIGPLNFENIPFTTVLIEPHYQANEADRSVRDHLTKLDLKNVKGLFISASQGTDSRDVVKFSSKHSKTLESLSIFGAKVPTSILPKFPNLKMLELANAEVLELDPVKFPLLNELHFSPSPVFRSDPHIGVKKLRYMSAALLEEGDEHYGDRIYQPDFPGSLKKMGRLFPNVEHLIMFLDESITADGVLDPEPKEILTTMIESFPRLKTLENIIDIKGHHIIRKLIHFP